MNKDILEGNWKQLKGKIKKQWGKFTDDEITQLKGKREEFSGVLQKKYGCSKEEAEKQIDKFVEENREVNEER